jgi:hypothetical protein
VSWLAWLVAGRTAGDVPFGLIPAALFEDWQLAQSGEPLKKIEPLD